jgi:hypothetical protein
MRVTFILAALAAAVSAAPVQATSNGVGKYFALRDIVLTILSTL